MPASPPLNTRKPRVSLLLPILCVLGGILIGVGFPQQTNLAIGVGVLASWIVGIFVVAPLAGKHGKDNFMRSLAAPTEEEGEMIQMASAHIVANMAVMAEDDEMSVVFKPIVKRIGHIMNENWEMSLKNLASQREKGVGIFNPENAIDEAGMMQKLKADLMGGLVEPLLDSVGFEGDQRENARNMIMFKMATAGNGGSGLPSPLNSGSSSGW